MTRSYNQDCILAHALDILGERWTMLIARELFLGPRRFADLMTALPGIGANLLSKRLKALEALAIVETDMAGANRHQYRLLPAGENLRPSLRAMMLWSIDYFMSRAEPSQVTDYILSNNLNPDSVALAMELFASSIPPRDFDYVAHILLDDAPYTLYYQNHDMIARRGHDAPAVAQVSFSVAAAMEAFRGEISHDMLMEKIKGSGRDDVVRHIIDCMTLEGQRYTTKQAEKLSA